MSTNFEAYKLRHGLPAEPKNMYLLKRNDFRAVVDYDKPAPDQLPTPSPVVGYADPEES